MWIPETTFNLYSYYIYDCKKLPEGKIIVKCYLVIYCTSSTLVSPKLYISCQNSHPNASTIPSLLSCTDTLYMCMTLRFVVLSTASSIHPSSACLAKQGTKVLLGQKCFQTSQTELLMYLGSIQKTSKGLGWCVEQACFKMHVLTTECTILQFYPWCEGNSPVQWTVLWYRNTLILQLTEISGSLMTKLRFALGLFCFKKLTNLSKQSHGKKDLMRIS